MQRSVLYAVAGLARKVHSAPRPLRLIALAPNHRREQEASGGGKAPRGLVVGRLIDAFVEEIDSVAAAPYLLKK